MRHSTFNASYAFGSALCFLCIAWAALASCAQVETVHGTRAFERLSQRAANARDAGDLTSATKLYREAVGVNPKWQEGWWYLGSLYYDGGRYREAVGALRRLTTLDSSLGAAWALLGLSEFETHEFSASVTHIERGQRLGVGDHPELADVADYHLALLLNLQGRCEEARQLLSKLLLAGKNSEDVQVGLGLSLLRVPLLPKQLDPSKDALIHSAGEVAAFIARRQYEQADIGFQNLVKEYPQTHFVHYAYGAMLAGRGQDDAAEAQFQQETELTPESALAYSEWAFIEFGAKRYEKALPLAQTAAKLSPGFFMAHYLLGSILLAQGDTTGSLTQLETARRLAPESPEIRYSLARAYAKSGKADLARREHAEFLRLRSLQDAATRDKQLQDESKAGDVAEKSVDQTNH